MISRNVVVLNDPKIGRGVEIQDYCVIGKSGSKEPKRMTAIGDNSRILSHVVIYNGCNIGKNCLIADYAGIRENVIIGEHTVIGRAVMIENDTTIGSNCLIETQSHVTAYAVIEDYVFLGAHVITTNDRLMAHPLKYRTKLQPPELKGPIIKRGARIGSGACILPGITIGEEAVVGANALVSHDIPAQTLYYGIPARIRGRVPKDQLLQV